ncbi:MAG: endonuclease/exonuclease/phosphatase family protein [Prevotella sp.]|nr:endonuclease/exonuclease/phosphatase family protein [Prevotella sp.]
MGATAMLAALTVLVAYSDHIYPEGHTFLACVGMAYPFFLAAMVIVLLTWVLVSWKRAWLPLLALIITIPATRVYIPLHFKSTPPEGCIKIVSYNVCGYGINAHHPDPLDAISRYLDRQQADIVCLQEDMSTKFKPVERYDSLFPYNDTVHVNKPGTIMINALGIHTRYPILRKERISYESNANGSVAWFLLIDGDTVAVVNNHLESTHLSSGDRQRYTDMLDGALDSTDVQTETRFLVGKLATYMAKRAVQAETVSNYVDSIKQLYPVIVCGDFNDTPISYARRTIAKGLTDCYVETGNGPGISFNMRGFKFRIDQMMCSDHFEPYSCYIDDKMEDSDHYPVVCWLEKKR